MLVLSQTPEDEEIEKMFNLEEERDESKTKKQEEIAEQEERDPTWKEVAYALRGVDELTMEMIRAAGEASIQLLYRVLRVVWKENKLAMAFLASDQVGPSPVTMGCTIHDYSTTCLVANNLFCYKPLPIGVVGETSSWGTRRIYDLGVRDRRGNTIPYCYHIATVLAPYVYDTMSVYEGPYCAAFKFQNKIYALHGLKSMAEVHILGQILGASEFPKNTLFCKWGIHAADGGRLVGMARFRADAMRLKEILYIYNPFSSSRNKAGIQSYTGIKPLTFNPEDKPAIN
uniref:Uncharacterized protein n=1 Tax=Timema bartmani TaxID=61472 RepID=A0A7R9F9L8_9NEOP|nr:unnamed protein product [Timema bartmani]